LKRSVSRKAERPPKKQRGFRGSFDIQGRAGKLAGHTKTEVCTQGEEKRIKNHTFTVGWGRGDASKEFEAGKMPGVCVSKSTEGKG